MSKFACRRRRAVTRCARSQSRFGLAITRGRIDATAENIALLVPAIPLVVAETRRIGLRVRIRLNLSEVKRIAAPPQQ